MADRRLPDGALGPAERLRCPWARLKPGVKRAPDPELPITSYEAFSWPRISPAAFFSV